MKKTTFLLAALGLCAASASADQISKNKAQAIAESFFQKGSMPTRAQDAAVNLTKEYASSKEAPTAIYAFSRAQNVVFVSADDEMPAILGYSDNADVNDLPPALEGLLSYYTALTDAVRNGTTRAPQLYASEAPVDSLCFTQWNQTLPFISLCPIKDGEHMPNGCVSTAYAQVMKYHKWPVTPTGTTPAYTSGNIDIPAVDLSTHTYKWEDMLDDYNGSYTEEQGLAVAQLCYDVSVASNMDFRLDGSGTPSILAARAMRTYFGYNKGLKVDYASFYSEAEWVAKLKNEINQGRPMPYDGFTDKDPLMTEGHCFVIDGYNAEGRFHVNWGWGGKSNGYFLITSLEPKEHGTGGSSSSQGFSYRQHALFDFFPDPDGTSTFEEYHRISYNNCAGFGSDSLEIISLYNKGIDDFHGDIVMQLVDTDGKVAGQRTVKTNYSLVIDKHENVYVSIKDFDFSSFADGVYHTELLMVSSDTGKEYPVSHLDVDARIFVENGQLKSIRNHALLEGRILSCEKLEYDDLFLRVKVKVEIKNTDNIDFPKTVEGSTLYITIYDPNNISIKDSGLGSQTIEVKAGETITYEKELETICFNTADCLDRAMVRVDLYNEKSILASVKYPFMDLVTGIQQLKVEQEAAPAFNVYGQRVDAATAKGIIIQNGKKTFK